MLGVEVHGSAGLPGEEAGSQADGKGTPVASPMLCLAWGGSRDGGEALA